MPMAAIIPSSEQETAAERIQILVPIFNEGENINILYRRMLQDGVHFDSLKFIYDIDNDTSLPFIAAITASDPRVCAEKNQLGRGVLNALRWGVSHAEAGPVIVVMGDNSDKLSLIPEMIERWRAGACLVSPSRYMPGGEQRGGGWLKSGLSRVAGTSLAFLGFPTADPTNNFKLYDGLWLREQTIESAGGFELALELSYKAFRDGRRIEELPTVWEDRTFGQSNFRFFAWLPHYLRWYFHCLGAIFLSYFRRSKTR